MPPVPAWRFVVEVVLVLPSVTVLAPAPVPMLTVPFTLSVERETVPPLAVIPAKVSVSVAPEPPKDSPVLPPANVNDADVNGPPVSPLIVIPLVVPVSDPN